MSDHSAKLCEQALAGDLEAASELVSQCYARIYAWFRRLAGNDEDAADLTKKTFCKVWNSLAKFHGRSSFNTWLHSIAHHVYVDWRRANHRTEPRSDDWWSACASREPAPDALATRADLAARLFACVDALEVAVRDTVHLHYYQELTLQETAAALGIATSTVKYRLRQALTELQKKAAEDFGTTRPRCNT